MSKSNPEPQKSKGEREMRWGPSVNDEQQQPNPSPHRSFHPDKYAPTADEPRRTPPKGEKEEAGVGTSSESLTTSGEDQKGKSRGMHDTGPHGKSRRPSGEKDASAYTGVNPEDSSTGDGSR